MNINAKTCIHLPQEHELIKAAQPQCQKCVEMGSTWVHLRTCQTCGETHCCDSSPNKHATKHFLETNHPVVTSAEPREDWAWCYVDNLFMSLS